ncbi:MAG: LLM class flavin-dependent oxidoreductase [Pseudomonadota bacterium]|nr:LLM class flavin-dependent oxidoreductase [Pseudomonadota bacterium]
MTGTRQTGGRRRVRRGIALTPMETRRDVIVRMAVLADRLGYELFSVPEGWGFDSTLVLTEIALKTRRLRPMSGILSIWTRTPGAIAMNAATLADISGGRYVLGLGASTRALVEGYHGVPYSRPRKRLIETTEEIRRLLRGDRAEIPDDLDSRPLKMGQAPHPDLPVYIAAIGPKTIRAAALHGDGWFPYCYARDRFARAVPDLRAARAEAGLDPEAFTILGGPMVSLRVDRDQARAAVAANIAWYITAMGDVYAGSLRRQGFGTAVKAVIAANPKPHPQTGIVPDGAAQLLDQLSLHGRAEDITRGLDAWDDAVDITMLGLLPGSSWPEIEAILHAAAPPGGAEEPLRDAG